MPKQCCIDFWDNKIPLDEPVFTLVARDKLAAKVVRYWNELAKEAGVSDMKIRKGVEHAEAMEAFAIEHPERMKLPD